jgi:outer membrane lipoprotein carrier protein
VKAIWTRAVISCSLLNCLLIFICRAEQNPKDLIEKFERRYRSARTLEALFVERYIESGKEVRSEAGTAYFGRPGRMRWEYASPERNLYVVDGKWSWFYVPSDHTVTRTRARASADWRTPLALLAGEMKLSRICARVEGAKGKEPVEAGGAVLSCRLRRSDPARATLGNPAEADPDVLFEVNRETGELSRILIADPGGIRVEFRFANWRFDPRLDGALFRFAPPRGVAIVDGDLAVDPPASGPRPAAGSF